MIVNFKQTTKDYITASKYISKKLSLKTKWRYLGLFSTFSFGVLLVIGLVLIKEHYVLYPWFESSELNKGLITIAIGTSILIVGMFIYTKIYQSKMFSKDGLFLSNQEFKIEKEHLFQNMGGNKYYYQWKHIKEIEKTNNFIFLFIDNGVAIYIPHHAFENDDEYENFYNALCTAEQSS